MRKLTAWLVVALLTFSVGIAAVFIWATGQRSLVRSNQISNQQCGEGLISAALQPNAPLRLSVLPATCSDARMPNARFEVENVSRKSVSQYMICGFCTYEKTEDEMLGIQSKSGLNLEPRQKRADQIAGRVMYSPLKSYRLAVCAVTFTDGTVWQMAQEGER